MKNKIAWSFLFALSLALSACGSRSTTASSATEAPYSRGNAYPTIPPAATQASSTDNYGYGDYGNPAAAQPAATAASNPPSGQAATLAVGPGSFLVDGNGMTLYLFTKDSAGTSNCSGGCASNWPPLTVTGQPVAGAGVNASLLGTTARADGSVQVTYNGHPLYYYKADHAPGDENGQGAGGVWYVVSATGDAVH